MHGHDAAHAAGVSVRSTGCLAMQALRRRAKPNRQLSQPVEIATGNTAPVRHGIMERAVRDRRDRLAASA